MAQAVGQAFQPALPRCFPYCWGSLILLQVLLRPGVMPSLLESDLQSSPRNKVANPSLSPKIRQMPEDSKHGKGLLRLMTFGTALAFGILAAIIVSMGDFIGGNATF